MKQVLFAVAGATCIATASSAATYNDRTTFLGLTGGFVEHNDLTSDFSISAEPGSSLNSSYSTFTDKFAPNPYVILNGVENFNAVLLFTDAIYAFGMDVYEPQASTDTFNGCNVSTCVESTFEISFLSSGSTLDTVTFEPENEILDFFGYTSDTAFDRVEIRETVGTNDNEMFGNFVTSTTPVPLPAGLPLLAAGLGAIALLRRRKSG